MKRFNYDNTEYLHRLNGLPPEYYSKYIRILRRYLKKKTDAFIDIGCGNGYVLGSLKSRGYSRGVGVEISHTFITYAKNQGISNILWYDGITLPFKPKTFTVSASFNVLEHVLHPEQFICEQVRVVKHYGYICIACPNFLTVVSPGNHPNVSGIINKFRNTGRIAARLFRPKLTFSRMNQIFNKRFHYDDDAVVVTNIPDIKNLLILNGCTIVYESGFIQYSSVITDCIDRITVLRYLMPSCFIITQKTQR